MKDYVYESIELKGKEIEYIHKQLLNKEAELFRLLINTKDELALKELNKRYFLCKQCRLKFEE